MINIHESDMQGCIIWFDDPHCKESEIVFLRYLLVYVFFGLRPSPAILGAVIAHLLYKAEKPSVRPSVCVTG